MHEAVQAPEFLACIRMPQVQEENDLKNDALAPLTAVLHLELPALASCKMLGFAFRQDHGMASRARPEDSVQHVRKQSSLGSFVGGSLGASNVQQE